MKSHIFSTPMTDQLCSDAFGYANLKPVSKLLHPCLDCRVKCESAAFGMPQVLAVPGIDIRDDAGTEDEEEVEPAVSDQEESSGGSDEDSADENLQRRLSPGLAELQVCSGLRLKSLLSVACLVVAVASPIKAHRP